MIYAKKQSEISVTLQSALLLLYKLVFVFLRILHEQVDSGNSALVLALVVRENVGPISSSCVHVVVTFLSRSTISSL